MATLYEYAEGVISNSLGSPRSGAPQVSVPEERTLKGFHNRALTVWNAFSVRPNEHLIQGWRFAYPRLLDVTPSAYFSLSGLLEGLTAIKTELTVPPIVSPRKHKPSEGHPRCTLRFCLLG
mgnify:FL=1